MRFKGKAAKIHVTPTQLEALIAEGSKHAEILGSLGDPEDAERTDATKYQAVAAYVASGIELALPGCLGGLEVSDGLLVELILRPFPQEGSET